ncbi:MAG: hypothetical protein ACLTYN_16005 [Dysosmobacter welbionis]
MGRVLSSTGWWDGRTLPMWAPPRQDHSVNYFLIDRRAYLVDLPGYGCAGSPRRRRAWAKLMSYPGSGPDHHRRADRGHPPQAHGQRSCDARLVPPDGLSGS